MTQKFLGHPLLVFYPPTGSSATHIRGQWENHMCRIHAGSSKARSAARQDITAETLVNFGTNEHPHKAAIILITY